MIKNIRAMALICFCFSLTGCFEIIDQLTLNADGSGSFQVTANFSQSKTKINSIKKMKTINGHKVPTETEANNEISKLKTTLSGVSGISDVSTTTDYTNYIGTISFKFDKIASLNAGLKKVSGMSGAKENTEVAKTFSYDAATKTFARTNKLPLKKYYGKVSTADKEIFTGATYTTINKFSSEVKTNSNASATTSPSKKAVMVKHSILDIINGKKNIDNTITIK